MDRVKSILFGPLPPPFGGVSVFMTAISARAMQQGVRVWSYTGKPLNESQNEILFINHRRFGHLLALWHEGRRARITDSTHFHLEYPHILLLPLWLLSKFFLRFKWIKILHDGSLPSRHENFHWLQRRLFNLAARYVNEFIVYDRNLEKWLRDTIGVSQKINSIRPLLPLPPNWHEKPLDENVTAKLARYSGHQWRVCSVGIFIPSYGFHQIAESVEKLRQETGIDIGLMFADGGFECDEDYFSNVIKNREWVEVVNSGVPHILKQSHVFVRGFAHESYGLSRIEAIWCGVPVIATNVGETRGMFVYEYGDEETLISHLRKVLKGENASDTQTWAEIFHREAEQNLESFLQVIEGDE
jgi:glycosyltransferase involved in cell wall biosynthesis